EYWPLELYKLSLAPKEAEFSRKIAFVTGGAGGIGSATCYRLVSEGAHVVLADINLDGAQQLANEINDQVGDNRATAVKLAVREEEELGTAIPSPVQRDCGLDVIVNKAGRARSSPFGEPTIDTWKRMMNVTITRYC